MYSIRGVNAVRYSLAKSEDIVKLSKQVNRLIRHPVRLQQFEEVCQRLGLNVKQPDQLHINHGWYAGVFDSDGSIFWNNKNNLVISVGQKYKEIPDYFNKLFGGRVYYNKQETGSWYWRISAKKDVLFFIQYLEEFPCPIIKRQKVAKVSGFYMLKSQGAHYPPFHQKHNPGLYKQ